MSDVLPTGNIDRTEQPTALVYITACPATPSLPGSASPKPSPSTCRPRCAASPMNSKRMPSLESQLLAAVSKRLKALAVADPHLVWRKRHGSAMVTAGDPDLYGLYYSHHWEVELKLPGKSPTLLQQFRLDQWKQAGALTFVVHSIQEFDDAIRTIRGSE